MSGHAGLVGYVQDANGVRRGVIGRKVHKIKAMWNFQARRAAPATVPAAAEVPHHDSAREILELLELELGAMIRQLERAANSVAGGAQSTAATLSNIRARTDALTGRTSAAHLTATTFSQAAEKFTHSAEGIGRQGRDASKLADQATAAPPHASLNLN